MAETPDINRTTTIDPCKILRKSTHTFLTHFHHFTSSPALLCLPFSLFLLLHLSPSPSVLPLHLYRRLHSLLLAGGFPLSSPASHLLLLKLSQTLSSSLSSLPLSLSFLLLSKSSTIQSLRDHHHPPPPESTFFTLLHTQFYNLLLLVAANSTCFALLCLAFAAAPTWASASISAAGAVIYSVAVVNAVILCNLSLIAAGWEGEGGVFPILRSFVLIRGRATTALLLSLPANLAIASIEAVFRFRIYGSGAAGRAAWAVAAEALFIAYLYSVLIVGGTIVECLFYTSCKDEEDDEMEEYESDLNKLSALEEGI